MPNDDKTPAPEQQPPPPAPPSPLRAVASVIPLLGRLPGPVQDGIALVLIALVIVPGAASSLRIAADIWAGDREPITIKTPAALGLDGGDVVPPPPKADDDDSAEE